MGYKREPINHGGTCRLGLEIRSYWDFSYPAAKKIFNSIQEFFSKKVRGGQNVFSAKKGGRRLFFRKNKGAKTFFSTNIGWAKTCLGKFFPKPSLGTW